MADGMAVSGNMDGTSFQEQALRHAADVSGSMADLVCYYALRRDVVALEGLAAELNPDDFTGCLYYELVTLDAASQLPDDMPERLREQEAAWPWLACTKHCLRQDRLPDALQLAITRLQISKGDLLPLNLVAKYLLAREDYDTAEQVIAHSVRLGPHQGDLIRLQEMVTARKPWRSPLFLDPLPALKPVAFYIPAYNVEAFMAPALDGLFGMNYPLQEVLVVDDGSRDTSLEIARRYPVRILKHATNRGLAAARNTAFQEAGAAFLGAIDTDAVPDPDYLLHAMLEFENAFENLAGVGGKLIEHHTDTPVDKWRALTLAQHRGSVRQYGEIGLFGSNTVFHREAVLAVEGYDERHRTNGEDHTLCNALNQHGYAHAYTPFAVARHLRRDTIESVLRTLWNWNYWGWRESGAYASRIKLWEKLRIACEKSGECLTDDIKEDRHVIAYIDLLMFFDTVYRDTARAAEDYLLTTAEAYLTMQRLLEQSAALDTGRGGKLADKIREYLNTLLPESLPPTRIRPEVQAEVQYWLDGIQTPLAGMFSGCGFDFYCAMLDTR